MICHFPNLNWAVKTFSCTILQRCDIPISSIGTLHCVILHEPHAQTFQNLTFFLQWVYILIWENCKLLSRLQMLNTPSVCRTPKSKNQLAPLLVLKLIQWPPGQTTMMDYTWHFQTYIINSFMKNKQNMYENVTYGPLQKIPCWNFWKMAWL